VFIRNLGQLAAGESRLEPGEGGPDPAVDVRDFSINQLADEDFLTGANGLNDAEDKSALRVRPPTTMNPFACNKVGKIWHLAVT